MSDWSETATVNVQAKTHHHIRTHREFRSVRRHKTRRRTAHRRRRRIHRSRRHVKRLTHKPRLRRSNRGRFLRYHFITQTGRGNANDACEADSLLMALNHFGLAKHRTLDQFVRTIPRSRDPERGYTNNPYRLGTGASLYPQALLQVAKRYGAKRSYIIDDYYPHRRHGNRLFRRKASANAFINALQKGYPVVFEGGNRMQYGGRTRRRGYRGYQSDHVLLLYGYKNHRFYWTDPYQRHNRPGSTNVKLFMYIINAQVRGPRAVAIGK